MSFVNRFAIPALLVASAMVAEPTFSFAQTTTPAGQSDEDHAAHHPGGKPPAAMPSDEMPMGTMGRDGQAGMMAGDMKQMMSMMRSMMTMMSAESGMMASHVEGRIASLKSELAITDAQTPQWNRFADALRAAAKSMNGMYGQMMQPKGTALPARLDAQETMLSVHLASLKALKEALDPLYASFSDDQKKRADGLMIGPMGMM
mgnify:CR=1 FL=1